MIGFGSPRRQIADLGDSEPLIALPSFGRQWKAPRGLHWGERLDYPRDLPRVFVKLEAVPNPSMSYRLCQRSIFLALVYRNSQALSIRPPGCRFHQGHPRLFKDVF